MSECSRRCCKGGAKGADKLSEKWADDNNIDKDIYYPDWNKYGKKAGYIRNQSIIENSDRVIAFWDGSSKGTSHSINLAKKDDKPYKIIYYNDEVFMRKLKIKKIKENYE